MKFLIPLCFVFIAFGAFGQQLNNMSMEGEPIDATMPDGWHACQEGTTPDILPGPWGVEEEPYDGNTYVGLITRPNGTWEAIGQRFSIPLKDKSCYTMGMLLAHSDTYAGYNEPGRIRVYLGKSKCDYAQLILDVASLSHTEWEYYPIRFTTEDTYQYIIIESFHPKGKRTSSGNILIDKIDPPVFCDRT